MLRTKDCPIACLLRPRLYAHHPRSQPLTFNTVTFLCGFSEVKVTELLKQRTECRRLKSDWDEPPGTKLICWSISCVHFETSQFNVIKARADTFQLPTEQTNLLLIVVATSAFNLLYLVSQYMLNEQPGYYKCWVLLSKKRLQFPWHYLAQHITDPVIHHYLDVRKLKPYKASVVNSGLLGTTRSISIHWLVFQYLGIQPFFFINSHRTYVDWENKWWYFQKSLANSHQHLSKHIWNNRPFKQHLFFFIKSSN